MDVSVTIANWNRADLLERCLSSVFTTTRSLEYEVIVVDNASMDHSVQLVRERFPDVSLIVNTENRGFGRAHNQAARIARGRYILVLNNDAAVQPDTIPVLVRFMDLRPSCGICSCPGYRHRGSSELTSSADQYFSQFVWYTLLWNLWLVLRPPLGWDRCSWISPVRRWFTREPLLSSEVKAAWMTGALLMLRQQMLKSIGGFDERFFLFFEEVDLCRRARLSGWEVMLTNMTFYLHQGGASSELRNDIERLRAESGAIYFRKHHGPLAGEMFRLQHYLFRMCLLQWRNRLGQVIRGLCQGKSASCGQDKRI